MVNYPPRRISPLGKGVEESTTAWTNSAKTALLGLIGCYRSKTMLTKRERKLLVGARKILEGGGEYFICIALATASSDDLQKEYFRLTDYISNALGESATLDLWQYSNKISRTE